MTVNDFESAVSLFDGLTPFCGPVKKDYTSNFAGVMTALKFQTLHPDQREESKSDYDLETRIPSAADGEMFFEWASVLAAARAARGRFTMVELGAGYAARTVTASVLLAQVNPVPAQFVIVEGEPTHFKWAKQHFADNGLDWHDHWFLNRAVGTTTEPVLFPIGEGLYSNNITPPSGREELLKTITGTEAMELVLRNLVTEARMGVQLEVSNGYDFRDFDFAFVNCLTLEDILAPLETVDLLDVDIQRAEREVLPPSVALLGRKVKRIHIGTHGGDVHTELETLLVSSGWELVFNFPPGEVFETPAGRFTTSDGILSALNPALAGA